MISGRTNDLRQALPRLENHQASCQVMVFQGWGTGAAARNGARTGYSGSPLCGAEAWEKSGNPDVALSKQQAVKALTRLVR